MTTSAANGCPDVLRHAAWHELTKDMLLTCKINVKWKLHLWDQGNVTIIVTMQPNVTAGVCNNNSERAPLPP